MSKTFFREKSFEKFTHLFEFFQEDEKLKIII